MITHRLTRSLLRKYPKQLILLRTIETEINVVKSPGKPLDIPKNILLSSYVLDKLRKWDNRLALECIGTSRSYTYLDVINKSLALAQFLKNDLKLEEKSTVGVLLPNLPEYPIVVLGILTAGLIATTINPQYAEDEIKRQLVHSKSKALFVLFEIEHAYKIAESLGIPVISLKLKEGSSLHTGSINFFEIINTNLKATEECTTTSVGPDDVAFLPYSSGTTGISKGVELTHNNIVSNLEQIAAKEFCSLEDQDEVELVFIPFFHIYGLTSILFHGLCKGVKLVTFPKFTSEFFIRGLRKYRPTFIPIVPPIVQLMTNHPEIKPLEDLASVRLIISAAAPLQVTDIERFRDLTNEKTHLIQAYGMTELSPLATIQTPTVDGLKIGGSGFLVPNTEAKFVSLEDPENLVGLGPHVSGELLIRGPQVMKGYLDNPEATRETVTEDGWLKTGDTGYYDADGHIFITGRSKDLIKVKGFQVAPAELENILRQHPLVEDVVVIGVDHKVLGEAPKAFIVPRQRTLVKPEEIQGFLVGKVSRFKYLEGGVEFVDSIPKNVSGKVLRRELKKIK